MLTGELTVRYARWRVPHRHLGMRTLGLALFGPHNYFIGKKVVHVADGTTQWAILSPVQRPHFNETMTFRRPWLRSVTQSLCPPYAASAFHLLVVIHGTPE